MRKVAKCFLPIVVLILTSATVIAQFGQKAEPKNIRWNYSVKQVSDNEFDLIFKADVSQGWHLYGPYQEYKFGEGPLPLEVSYDSKTGFKLIGKLKSSQKPERVLDDIFGVYINQFNGKPIFTQRIVVDTETPFNINGTISGQICQDLCIQFDDNFEFQIKGAKMPEETDKASEIQGEDNNAEIKQGSDAVDEDSDNIDSEINEIETKGDKRSKSSLLSFFLIALGLGIAGIFTPCVFPMIPMNIAFFLNYRGGKTKGKFLAVFYGLSIIFIYSVIGLLITVLFGAEAMNNIVTHWLTNVIFFLIFVTFAASFFGAFELVLPSKWVNKADSQADRGGLVGTFFMALTLVLVSFSCTAAFIGTILVEAADGTSLLKPFIGMLGFSVGFGTPFALLALFPSIMQKMPKSGGWMNAVKVVFGFVILAFGMKFLIIPDQTYHLGLLNRDVYLAIWIVLFSLMGLYLLGKYKFSHDTDLKHISFFRLLIVIATFSFVVYLIPGLFGADLKGVSGLLPPKSILSFDLSKGVSNASATSGDNNSICGTPSYGDFLHLWHGNMAGYFDFDEAIECAKEKKKPIFIDFTGHGCSNCKVMEQAVLSDSRVMEIIGKEAIIATLYTDDRTTAPESKWKKTKDGTVLKTIGRINKYIQEEQFGTIATPLYAIIDHEGHVLSGTWQSDKDINGFIEFLNEGIDKFRQK